MILDALSSPAQRWWLLLLLLFWAALLFGGFLFGSSPQEERRMPKWTRLGSSAVLVLAAWSWVLFSRDSVVLPYALLIALGMTLGFLGDCFIAGVLRRSGKIGGIAAFALGHICYISGIVWLSARLTPPGAGPVLLTLSAWWLLALAGWYFVVYRPATAVTRIHRLVLPYALLLATTAAVATVLALQQPAFWPLVLGAALFLLSDTILGGAWFSGLRWPNIHDIIWLTYGPGQMLIVYSIGSALGLTPLGP